ncbi:MAG: molybdate ABC transporter substrate-binding protein [Geminicoccaceae bacterium]
MLESVESGRRRVLAAIGGLLAITATCTMATPRAHAADDGVLVFAAASLKNALDDVIATYGKESGTKVIASYAASSALAKQIEQGAPAQLFISADLDWMDYLEQRHLIADATRKNLLGNSLVLVASRDSQQGEVAIGQGFDLAALLGDGRLAVGDVKAVPAGKYAKASLEKLGAWSGVESKLAQSENVRAALALVARGEAPLGIVYKTDAASDPGVRIVGTFPADSHPPIIYPVAVTTAGEGGGAAAFLKFLETPSARSAFERYGFTLIGPVAS